MRDTAAKTVEVRASTIPRGWVVLGAAAACWIILISAWFGLSRLFAFVVSGV